MTTGAALAGILWGIFSVTVGLMLVTNYRGFLDQSTRERGRRALEARRRPSARRREFMRVFGALFGVLGLVVFVRSIIQLTTRPWRLPAVHPHFAIFSLIVVVPAIAVVVFSWSRGNRWLREAWAHGGAGRFSAISITVGAPVAFGGFAIQLPAIFIIGWAIMMPGVIISFLHRPAPPKL